MAFIDAFLGLCTSVGAGTCTELAAAGYARQPISFSMPASGVSKNATAWSFSRGFSGPPMAGRAVFDAPIGGNLLLVLPHYTARPFPMGGPVDSGDVGDITLTIPLMAAYPSGAAFTGLLAAGATVGTVYDVGEVVGTYSNAEGAPAGSTVIQLPGPQYRVVYASALTVGPGQLVINRGVLQLQARAQGIA